MNHVFLILGYPQNGKSTVRQQICARIGVTGASTSDVLYCELARLWGTSVHDLRAMPKETLRPHLVALGDLTVANDAGRLVYLTAAHGARAIDGIRRDSEFLAARRQLESSGFSPVTILVTRTDFPVIPDNTEAKVFRHANHYLTAGSVSELLEKTDLLLASLGYRGSVI